MLALAATKLNAYVDAVVALLLCEATDDTPPLVARVARLHHEILDDVQTRENHIAELEQLLEKARAFAPPALRLKMDAALSRRPR